MNIVKFDWDRSEEILKVLKGKRFVAFYYDEDTDMYGRACNNMSPQDIVWCATAAIRQELNECDPIIKE